MRVEPVQTDIFKHTFIDPEAAQETSSQSFILDKRPKDVFTYYDLQVELPTELFKHLGDYSIATEGQKALMKDFLHMHWPEVSSINHKFVCR